MLFAHYTAKSAVVLDMSTDYGQGRVCLSSLPGRQYQGVEPYLVTVRYIKLEILDPDTNH